MLYDWGMRMYIMDGWWVGGFAFGRGGRRKRKMCGDGDACLACEKQNWRNGLMKQRHTVRPEIQNGRIICIVQVSSEQPSQVERQTGRSSKRVSKQTRPSLSCKRYLQISQRNANQVFGTQD